MEFFLYNASMSEKLNVKNRTIFTDRRGFFTADGRPRKSEAIKKVVDNLHFLRGMNSECVDLIYLDPPFNSKRQYNAPLGEGKRAVFNDTWRMDMVKEEWAHKIAVRNPPLARVLEAAKETGSSPAGYRSNYPYLIYMAVRMLEMRRVLKPTGSVYLHCDPTMSHWLKLVMDCVFGADNFRNEIVWHYRTYQGRAGAHFPKKHDIILAYGKSGKAVFSLGYQDNYEETVDYRRWYKFYEHGNLIKFGNHPSGDSRFNSYLKRWEKEHGRRPKKGEVVYVCKGYVVDDVWDLQALDPKDTTEKTGYDTQKPLSLLKRIIQSSSREGDVVLDPFCGCATACIAAESLGRQWIGMDVSPVAFELVKKRLLKDLQIMVKNRRQSGDNEILRLQTKNNGAVDKGEAHHRTIPPQRSDGVKLDIKGGHGKVRDQLFAIQGGYCNGCGVSFPKVNFEIDHITPRLFGGLDMPTNLQLLCGACNKTKGAKTMDEFIAIRRNNQDHCRFIPESEYREKEEWEMQMEKGEVVLTPPPPRSR